jgi:hypothetical protein
MTRDGAQARQVVRLPVRLVGGEQVDLTASLRFGPAGALVDIAVVLAPPPRSSVLEQQAALLVEAIAGKMRRRRDLGIAELRRRAEAALVLLEQLEALEDAHGPEACALLAPAREAAA